MKNDLLNNRPPRRGGRPSQLEAGQIRERILDTAADLFLTCGYGDTSIEMIAKHTGISKRTFYHRFKDKADLFGAVVHRLISRLRPAQIAPLFEGLALEEILQGLAKVILHAALSPEALALHRLMISEAIRFPELATIMDTEGSRKEALERIAALLRHSGQVVDVNPQFAAEQFLQMVISVPQQRALGLGVPMNPTELDSWAQDTVKFFLNGWYGGGDHAP